MKLIALGDTHGRRNWQGITAGNDFDKVVFIGDYFDTHEGVSAHRQKQNFKDIVAYKTANMDKVVLLFGNHDYHYLRTVTETYSGFQQGQKEDIKELLHQALDEDLMQMCFVYGKYLFSHAGVTKTWCKNILGSGNPNKQNIETLINAKFKDQPEAFKFTIGDSYSIYGDDVCQTPIWVRPDSLRRDAISGFIQVVGHTTQQELLLTPPIILIDTLGTSGQYLVIEGGKMSVSSAGV